MWEQCSRWPFGGLVGFRENVSWTHLSHFDDAIASHLKLSLTRSQSHSTACWLTALLPHGFPFGNRGPNFFQVHILSIGLRQRESSVLSSSNVDYLCRPSDYLWWHKHCAQSDDSLFSNQPFYFNELAHFGQFVKYTNTIPICVPISAAEGPHLQWLHKGPQLRTWSSFGPYFTQKSSFSPIFFQNFPFIFIFPINTCTTCIFWII